MLYLPEMIVIQHIHSHQSRVTDENGCVESQSFQVNTTLAPVINQVYNQGFTVTGASSSN